MKTLPIFLILIFGLSVVGQSDRWRLITSSDNNSEFYYDTKTLTKAGSVITVWIEVRKTTGNIKTQSQFDCIAQKSRSLREIEYNSSGDSIRSLSNPSKWESPIPETVGERMLNVFCNGEKDSQWYEDENKKREKSSELLKKAEELEKSKEFTKALAVYDELIKLRPDGTYPYLTKARILMNLNRLKEAQTAALTAVRLNPDDSSGYYWLGNIYEKQNNLIAAEVNYWKSVKLDKKWLFGFYGLEKIYKNSKQNLKLIKLYQYGISAGRVSAYNQLADYYEKNNQTSLAKSTRLQGVGVLEKEMKTSYENAPELAALYVGLKQFNKTIQFAVKTLPYVENKYDQLSLLRSLSTAYEATDSPREFLEITAQIANLERELN